MTKRGEADETICPAGTPAALYLSLSLYECLNVLSFSSSSILMIHPLFDSSGVLEKIKLNLCMWFDADYFNSCSWRVAAFGALE